MSQLVSLRRVGTALGASALAATLAATLAVGVAPAHAVSSSSPAGHGATWLSHQLNKQGLIRNNSIQGFHFNDYGLTIDTVFAMKEMGGHQSDVAEARRALTKHVESYTTGADFGSSAEYAGSDAKLLVLAQRTGGGARDFGGTNLVSRLNDRVIDSGPSQGRIQDVVDTSPTTGGPDTSNVVGQLFAARGLLSADSANASAVLDFLLQQQCNRGFFRLNFDKNTKAAHQGCRKSDTADPDVTALVIIELTPLAKGRPALRSALRDAVAWLKQRQHQNGSFGGAGPTSAANANSTGLAGWALMDSGKCGAARDAAGWLADLQVTGKIAGTKLAGERGAIAYDHAALRSARKNGITVALRDQWRRAGAQAAPTLLALSRCGS